jgi:hypothetical protein
VAGQNDQFNNSKMLKKTCRKITTKSKLMNMVTRIRTTMARDITMRMASKSNKMIQMRSMDKRTMGRMTTKPIIDSYT